jgi:hypothetical protein
MCDDDGGAVRERIRALLAQLAAARSTRGTSFCPSEVARAVHKPEARWRTLMPTVREEADAMVTAGKLVATQRGARVRGSLAYVRGPLRLRAA